MLVKHETHPPNTLPNPTLPIKLRTLDLNKSFLLTRVGSDKDRDGGGVYGNEADEDVRQEEADQHQQPGDWVVCKHHLLAVSIAHVIYCPPERCL